MNENVTDRLKQSTTLADGTVITPAVPDPLRLRRDVMAQPFHSTTESTMAPTSEFARYFLLALPARYIPRGIINAPFEDGSPGWLRRGATKLLDGTFVNRLRDDINGVLEANPVSLPKGHDVMDEKAAEKALEENPKLKKGLNNILKRWNATGQAEDIVSWAYTRKEGKQMTSKSLDKIRSRVADRLSKTTYGAVVGVGSLALTLSYANMVKKDIQNLFSEAVGFEFDKPAKDVTFRDILRSDNTLVKQSLDNFWKKTSSRFLTDLPFFAAIKYPSSYMVDAMIGAKAGMLFGESWRRRNTMFEDLVTLVNEKVNPYNGLGQPITTAEVFDLYQHYHYNKGSEGDKTFNTIIERNTRDSLIWARSQRVFSRIADLLNQTYAYKHESELDANGNLIIKANFALPQFMYLLGHDLINPKDPEHTLAYIETANSYGMQAVKEVQEMFDLGMPVEAVIARFPVDRNLPSNHYLHDNHPFPEVKTYEEAVPKPNNTLEDTQRSLEGRIEQALASRAQPSLA